MTVTMTALDRTRRSRLKQVLIKVQMKYFNQEYMPVFWKGDYGWRYFVHMIYWKEQMPGWKKCDMGLFWGWWLNQINKW
jgi:hypothetical protein